MHNISFSKKIELLQNPKYYLAIITIFQNEAPFLQEWIEFHKLLGVEHFYLYNHLSQDNYQAILDPYLKDGTVELWNLLYQPKNSDEWNGYQWAVYLEATKKLKQETEWLIIIDSDEFLYPVVKNDLKQILRNYDDYASISINWRIFGSSNIKQIQKNELMIEKLVMQDGTPDLHVKSIVKPRYVETFNNQHFAVLQPGYKQITENFQPMNGPFSLSPSRNILAINHYKYRDWQFFNTTKLSRLHMLDSQLNEEEKNNRIKNLIEDNHKASSKYDNSILRFAPLLRLKLFGNIELTHPSKALTLPQNKIMFNLPNNLYLIKNSSNYQNNYNLINGYGDNHELIKKMIAFIRTEENYIEIGANYGEISLQISHMIGRNGKVYSFESDPNLSQYLSNNIFINGMNNIDLGNNSLIKTSTLDAYFLDKNISAIRIDSTNYELSLLQGAKNIINSSKDLKIFIKWQAPQDKNHLLELYASGFAFFNILKFNEECSYLTHQKIINYL
jgi:hypothetical protein